MEALDEFNETDLEDETLTERFQASLEQQLAAVPEDQRPQLTVTSMVRNSLDL